MATRHRKGYWVCTKRIEVLLVALQTCMQGPIGPLGIELGMAYSSLQTGIFSEPERSERSTKIDAALEFEWNIQLLAITTPGAAAFFLRARIAGRTRGTVVLVGEPTSDRWRCFEYA
jgi:hypothetical protein